MGQNWKWATGIRIEESTAGPKFPAGAAPPFSVSGVGSDFGMRFLIAAFNPYERACRLIAATVCSRRSAAGCYPRAPHSALSLQMPFLCPSCNSPSPLEARFCRLCGAPLKSAGGSSGPISPLAQTVPLTVEGRTTDGLPVDERNPNTARVNSAEMDKILHNQQLAQSMAAGNGGHGGSHYSGEHYAAPTTSSLVMPAAAQSPVKKSRWWPAILLTVVFVALAAGLLIYFLRPGDNNQTGVPGGTSVDQRAIVSQQLGEARALLAAGNTNEAIDRLHAVVNLDPSNVEAHRLLGAALMGNGRRRQAIDEYFIAAQKDPQDVDTLHTLATLQFQEQLYADAVDSYRRLASASGDSALPARDQLNYADALRLAGYTEDSRTEYQKLVAGAPAELATIAKQRLAQLPAQAAASLSVNARPLPATPSGSPGSLPGKPAGRRSVEGPSTTKPAPIRAQSGPDADYALGVSIVAGRDPKHMPRAELLRALAAAQRGAQGGQHRSEASRLAERLGREFDRRKSSGIQ